MSSMFWIGLWVYSVLIVLVVALAFMLTDLGL